MKKKKSKKQKADDMNVKPETAWMIVKNENGSYQWIKTKRGK